MIIKETIYACIQNLLTVGGAQEGEPIQVPFQNDFGQTTMKREDDQQGMKPSELWKVMLDNTIGLKDTLVAKEAEIAILIELMIQAYATNASQNNFLIVMHWTGNFTPPPTENLYDIIFDNSKMSDFVVKKDLNHRSWPTTGTGVLRGYSKETDPSNPPIVINIAVVGYYGAHQRLCNPFSDIKLDLETLQGFGVVSASTTDATVKQILDNPVCFAQMVENDGGVIDVEFGNNFVFSVLSGLQVTKFALAINMVRHAIDNVYTKIGSTGVEISLGITDHAVVREAEDSKSASNFYSLHWDFGASMPYLWLSRMRLWSEMWYQSETKMTELMDTIGHDINKICFVNPNQKTAEDSNIILHYGTAAESLYKNDEMLVYDGSQRLFGSKFISELFEGESIGPIGTDIDGVITGIVGPTVRTEDMGYLVRKYTGEVSTYTINHKKSWMSAELPNSGYTIVLHMIDSNINVIRDIIPAAIDVAAQGNLKDPSYIDPSVIRDSLNAMIQATVRDIEKVMTEQVSGGLTKYFDGSSDVMQEINAVNRDELRAMANTIKELAFPATIDKERDLARLVKSCTTLKETWIKFVGEKNTINLDDESIDTHGNGTLFNILDESAPGAYRFFNVVGSYRDIKEDWDIATDFASLLLGIIPIGKFFGKMGKLLKKGAKNTLVGASEVVIGEVIDEAADAIDNKIVSNSLKAIESTSKTGDQILALAANNDAAEHLVIQSTCVKALARSANVNQLEKKAGAMIAISEMATKNVANKVEETAGSLVPAMSNIRYLPNTENIAVLMTQAINPLTVSNVVVVGNKVMTDKQKLIALKMSGAAIDISDAVVDVSSKLGGKKNLLSKAVVVGSGIASAITVLFEKQIDAYIVKHVIRNEDLLATGFVIPLVAYCDPATTGSVIAIGSGLEKEMLNETIGDLSDGIQNNDGTLFANDYTYFDVELKAIKGVVISDVGYNIIS